MVWSSGPALGPAHSAAHWSCRSNVCHRGGMSCGKYRPYVDSSRTHVDRQLGRVDRQIDHQTIDPVHDVHHTHTMSLYYYISVLPLTLCLLLMDVLTTTCIYYMCETPCSVLVEVTDRQRVSSMVSHDVWGVGYIIG